MHYMKVWAAWAAVSMLPACGYRCLAQGAVPDPPKLAGIRILVDSIHAHNTLKLLPTDDPFNYHKEFGFRRAFDYLRTQSIETDEITTGRIDAKALAGYRVLFINLVTADLPPFLVSEISAIKKFVEDGGSLFVIMEHSNAYFHAYILMPLMAELGIDVKLETACEVAPETLGPGNGWIVVKRFAKHPITEGLRAYAMQTGCPVDDRYAVAFTSDRAWADQWSVMFYADTGDLPGHYGNWKPDPDERKGRLGVALAKELGKGKIEVVGDQNMFGDPFLNYADNYRLWLNSMAWLTGVSSLTNPEPYRAWRKPRILAYDRYTASAFAWSDPVLPGYYYIFAALGRKFWLFGSDDLTQDQDLVLFAHPAYALSNEDMDGLVHHMKAGKAVVILGDTAVPNDNQPNVIQQLKAKLGKPTIKNDNKKLVYTWPGYGPVLQILHELYVNPYVPNPETKPNPDKQAMEDALFEQIEDALRASAGK